MKSKKEFKPETDGLLCSKTSIPQELNMKEKLKLLILRLGSMNRVFHQFGNFQAPMPRRFLPQKPKSTFCTLLKEKLKLLILKPGLMNKVFHQFGNFQAPMP